MKNKLYSENDRIIFKYGFSMAIRIIMEALTIHNLIISYLKDGSLRKK